MKKRLSLMLTLCCLLACSPEVGSERWCKNMKEKPKADWTMGEAKDFAKHCVLK